jgi:hypothetical protein
MRSIADLSHLVGAHLKAPTTEKNRFKSMDLCADIMARADVTGDPLMNETLRSWIGKLQRRFENV